jgi:hypothetical protein
MVRPFVVGARQAADLQDGQFAQAFVEARGVADEHAKSHKGACGLGTVGQRAHEVDVAVENVLVLGRQLVQAQEGMRAMPSCSMLLSRLERNYT